MIVSIFSNCWTVDAQYLQKDLLQSPEDLESQLVRARELEPGSLQRHSLLQKC